MDLSNELKKKEIVNIPECLDVFDLNKKEEKKVLDVSNKVEKDNANVPECLDASNNKVKKR